MEPFKKMTALVAALDRADVDTDQIIPKQFLKRIERTGFGEFLFFDWMRTADGKLKQDFALNDPKYAGAGILVAGRNFGCGSSREHAPWALLEYGFRVLIAPSFADIFRSNCFQNGMLPIELPEDTVQQLMRKAEAGGYQLTVDLERNEVLDAGGVIATFQVDPFRRDCLLRGLDDIGLTLEHVDEIAAFERQHATA